MQDGNKLCQYCRQLIRMSYHKRQVSYRSHTIRAILLTNTQKDYVVGTFRRLSDADRFSRTIFVVSVSIHRQKIGSKFPVHLRSSSATTKIVQTTEIAGVGRTCRSWEDLPIQVATVGASTPVDFFSHSEVHLPFVYVRLLLFGSPYVRPRS